MKDFFGFGGYNRTPEGFLSWQHILFVTSLMIIMVALALWFGKRKKNESDEKKNKVLIFAALFIDAVEIFKIVIMCIRAQDALLWRYELPLFMCSTLLIAIPLAAFSRGRMKESALDFVLIFGILGAVLGTYGAGNNYGTYPVLCFDNVVSGITHATSGFASLYIGITGMAKMKKKNFPITFSVLLFFIVCAFVANKILNYNYMFLVRGDGTPYEILYSLVDGNPVLYPLGVVCMFLVYILLFYGIYFRTNHNRVKK